MERLGEVIVVGGSMAGRLAALALVRRGLPVTLLTEPGQSEEPIEGWYRSWWPSVDPGLSVFLGRGVDLLEALWEESRAGFRMDRRGELWLASVPADLEFLRTSAGRAGSTGLGPLREHTSHEWYLPSPPVGLSGSPGGLDLIEGLPALRAAFPNLELDGVGALHVRRAGAVDGEEFGRWLERVLAAEGVTKMRAEGSEISEVGGYHRMRFADGSVIAGAAVVHANGVGVPLDEVARITALLPAAEPPTEAPAARCRGANGDWLELLPLPSGWSAHWRTALSDLGHLPNRITAECARIGRLFGGLADRRPGFSTAISTLRLGPEGRPIVGLVGGRVVSAGHGGSLPSALAAAESIAEYVLEGRWPRYCGSIALGPIGAAPATID